MRIVKPLLVGLFTLFLVFTGISLMFPSQVMTSKWVMVARDDSGVLAEIRDLRAWPSWNDLLTGVSDMQVSQKTSHSDTGSRISWTDPRGGSNSMTVTENNKNGIVTLVRLGDERPFESGFSVQKRTTDSVQVVWFIIEKMKWYPWEKFYGMMAAEMKGPLMQSSLDRLKMKLETGP